MTAKAAQALVRWQYMIEHGQDRSNTKMTEQEWREEARKHRDFFGGLSPRDELKKSREGRKEIV